MSNYMFSIRKVWVTIFVTLSLSTTAFAGKLDSTSLDAIDGYIQSLMASGDYPGLSVSIYSGGEPAFEKGYGYANLEWNQKVTPDTVFEIGSISKTFTALSIHQLAKAGKLSLDDAIGEHITDLPESMRNLSIRHLLNHTSGLGNYTNSPDVVQYMQSPLLTLDEAFKIVVDRTPIEFQQGDAWAYSNSGTWLLSYIVEKASGESFADYLQKNIFQPFGMNKSQLNDYSEVIEHRASGYAKKDGEFSIAPHTVPTIPYGAGAIVSTAQDLQRYMAVLHNSNLISKDIKASMLRHEKLNDGRLTYYTTGCLMAGDFNGHRKVEHGGGIAGFNSQHAYYPDNQLGIVVLTNTIGVAKSAGEIESDIAKIIFKINQLSSGSEVSSNEFSKYIGEYRLTDFYSMMGGFSVIEQDGQLMVKLGGPMLSQLPAVPARKLGEKTILVDAGFLKLVLDISNNKPTATIGGFTFKVEHGL